MKTWLGNVQARRTGPMVARSPCPQRFGPFLRGQQATDLLARQKPGQGPSLVCETETSLQGPVREQGLGRGRSLLRNVLHTRWLLAHA